MDIDITIGFSNLINIEITDNAKNLFGSVNTTTGTLNEISNIFNNVLDIVFAPPEIYEITNGLYSCIGAVQQELHEAGKQLAVAEFNPQSMDRIVFV